MATLNHAGSNAEAKHAIRPAIQSRTRPASGCPRIGARLVQFGIAVRMNPAIAAGINPNSISCTCQSSGANRLGSAKPPVRANIQSTRAAADQRLAARKNGRNAIVQIAPCKDGVRPTDRAIVEVAAANDGRYTIDAHLKHDPSASEAFAESHVRRLEAMRKIMRSIEREPDGSWIITPDHLDKVERFEARRHRDRPVTIETLSRVPLDRLPAAQAATWLDRDLVAESPTQVRDAGFGHEVRNAQAARRQWLVAEQLADERDGRTIYRPGILATLQRRELLRVAGQLSDELRVPFAEAKPHERIQGRLVRAVELTSGRHALIERSRDFTLVPWRPVLERHICKQVSGIMSDGGISWNFGRQRSGPSIS